MDNHERVMATYEALKKRRAARAKKKDREADNATAELIKHKCRGRSNTICNSISKWRYL